MQEWWKYEERDVTIFTRSCKPFLRSSCLAWQQTSSLVFCALNQSIKKMCTHINITEETPDLEKGGVELTAKLLKSKLQFLFCAFYILITKISKRTWLHSKLYRGSSTGVQLLSDSLRYSGHESDGFKRPNWSEISKVLQRAYSNWQ